VAVVDEDEGSCIAGTGIPWIAKISLEEGTSPGRKAAQMRYPGPSITKLTRTLDEVTERVFFDTNEGGGERGLNSRYRTDRVPIGSFDGSEQLTEKDVLDGRSQWFGQSTQRTKEFLEVPHRKIFHWVDPQSYCFNKPEAEDDDDKKILMSLSNVATTFGVSQTTDTTSLSIILRGSWVIKLVPWIL
jgi:hypothetical protein